MASLKAALKAARTALEARDYEEAADQARTVLEIDKNNYFANVFLGRALEKQARPNEAAAAYQSATRAKPDDENAWKGLCSLWETSKNIDGHTEASMKLAELYMDRDDQHQCQGTVNKLVEFAKDNGSRDQYKQALAAYLPSSPVFAFLEGRIQSPALTFKRLAEITEADDKERVAKLVAERRLRLGAKLNQVVTEVSREIYDSSNLEYLYQNIIDWTSDDYERRCYEEKLLEHAYDHLVVLSGDAKAAKRQKVVALAHGMVVVKHPQRLAWHIELEWHDMDSFDAIDKDTQVQYCQLFPSSGLAKVIQGYLGTKFEPEKPESAAGDIEKESLKSVQTMDSEHRLIILTDGLIDSSDSALAHRLVAQYYLQIQEYENSVEISRKALTLLLSESNKSGLTLQESRDATNTNLGTSLVYYQSPKNHPEASELFDDVLKRKPDSTDALLGIGLIYEERQDFEQAALFLQRASDRDPTNVTVASEAAWCRALNGELRAGLEELQNCLGSIQQSKTASLDLRAQTLYRVGKCMWDLNPDKASRKLRTGPYAFYIAALKANPSYAPAYTALGLFYADYSRDRKRARQCFQKSFELSASEIVAAERLARDFAIGAEWDIVEVIAKRTIDSGVVKPFPGSKRKPVSWPFAAMGIVQMNKQEFPLAVHSYQAALRISPEDYNSWVGLGESYLSSGRYNAARRVLEHAQDLVQESEDIWFARYMRSNVRREIGDYDEAVDGYQTVLQARDFEFGVSIALLQTLIEFANDCVDKGLFNRAAHLAGSALQESNRVLQAHAPTVNLWKAVGDICAVFGSLPGLAVEIPLDTLREVLGKTESDTSLSLLEDLDQVKLQDLDRDGGNTPHRVVAALVGTILAHKRAVQASQHDLHARAVAWYNLGWAEYSAYHIYRTVPETHVGAKFAMSGKSAVKCFKHAIELESGNADFWNALGVVTAMLNPQVSQHSFVRSLHLNERSARTWVNLGALYMFEGDYELAHEAFSRAQSTEPDYIYAWLGEGLIALHMGNEQEAYSHFSHAIEIAGASAVSIKSRYVAASFDRLLVDVAAAHDLPDLLAPLFALQQLQVQVMDLLRYRHLLALMEERAGDYEAAVETLVQVAEQVEQAYEASEASHELGQFIRAKSDLARCQLAAKMYEEAIENSNTSLDLSEELEQGAMSSLVRSKIRLSSHLSAAVASFHTSSMDTAFQMFRTALEESDHDPDVVCLFAKVLWTKGSAQEQSMAKEELLESVEKSSGHVESTILLGAISSLDGDEQTHGAVLEDLQAMRGSSRLSLKQQQQIDSLIRSSAASCKDSKEDEANEIKRTILLSPDQPVGWSELADVSKDRTIGGIAYQRAAHAVPPDGSLTAEELARAAADVATVSDFQRASVLCPWAACGWSAFESSLSET